MIELKGKVYGELADEKQVNHLIMQVRDLNINVDILYNNAAVMTPYHEDYWSHNWDEWTKSFKVNVMAMYSLCGAFIPAMIENGFGRVINLTSGIMDQPELAPYDASNWLRTDMGGENADHPVEAVLPGALAPALIDSNGPNGEFFSAIELHNT